MNEKADIFSLSDFNKKPEFTIISTATLTPEYLVDMHPKYLH